MSAILALLLCAASGTVYEATLGQIGEKSAEVFNNVAFFAGDPAQIRGAAGSTPTADR